MTKARRELISAEQTPYYHCMVRCVRRAFLCGDDALTERNFDHRRQWMVNRLKQLSAIFAIDVCAYAIMSNHYHVVLHINEARAKQWSDEDVVLRWKNLCKGNVLVDRWLLKEKISAAELEAALQVIDQWRERLLSISWFMKFTNEFIAREANKEDQCKGHFWEGRFKSQALLDEAALLTCMAYVDLNPIRAGLESTPENSDYSSIQKRLYDYVVAKRKTNNKCISKQKVDALKRRLDAQSSVCPVDKRLPQAPLMPFDGSAHTPLNVALPFIESDYFLLVEQTGRIIREDKHGFIPTDIPDLLTRFGLDSEHWLACLKCYGPRFSHVAGTEQSLKYHAEHSGKCWLKGIKALPLRSAA